MSARERLDLERGRSSLWPSAGEIPRRAMREGERLLNTADLRIGSLRVTTARLASSEVGGAGASDVRASAKPGSLVERRG